MPSASLSPDSVRFPRKCPHCGGKAAGTYAVAAVRGLDAFLGSYTMPPLLDVPVCRAAFERRRRAAVVLLASTLAIMVLCGGAALVLAFERAWLTAALVALPAIAAALLGRTGADAGLLDRWVLGCAARSESSTRMRVFLKRADYFAEWKKVNRL